MDIEAPQRTEALRRLDTAFDLWPLERCRTSSGYQGELDILARPKETSFSNFLLNIEVKSHSFISDRDLGKWIKQCADYVYAEPARFPGNVVCASFLWLVQIRQDEKEPDATIMRGMLQLAQYFRVGTIVESKRGALIFQFGGGHEIFKDGWKPRAKELLSARRQQGGVRRALLSGNPTKLRDG